MNNPLLPWTDAINQPGAAQMQHARALLESRPFLTRMSGDDLIVTARVATSVPGAGRYRFVATRDSEGTYVMVYAPVGRSFTVSTSAIKGRRIRAWWFNPRDGRARSIGTFQNSGEREFSRPDAGEMLDWVLVLDDEAKNYPPPGQAVTDVASAHFSVRGGRAA